MARREPLKEVGKIVLSNSRKGIMIHIGDIIYTVKTDHLIDVLNEYQQHVVIYELPRR